MFSLTTESSGVRSTADSVTDCNTSVPLVRVIYLTKMKSLLLLNYMTTIKIISNL